jgi:hypothetical protein
MQAAEQGRFCGTCKKTVVDFSMMTDREMVQYLSRAGEGVCGRFAPEQMNRPIVLGTVGAKGWRGWWHWVLAGLLLSVKAEAQDQPKVATEQVIAPGRKKAEDITKDSIKIRVLPEVVVYAGSNDNCRRMGGLMYSIKVDSMSQRVADTLAVLGWKKELAIYPNPVQKGMAVTLSWRGMEPGLYMVELFNAAGAMMLQRAMQVNAKEQIDLLEIPASLSGGIYLLRAARVGEANPVTRKIIVL